MKDNNEGKTFGVYAVKDLLVGRFMQPIFLDNDDMAKRWFKNTLNEISMWKNNAGDFAIYRIGHFNDKDGLTDYPVCEELANGMSVVERSKNE